MKLLIKIRFKLVSFIWNFFGKTLVILGLARRERKTELFSDEELFSRQWFRHKQFVDFLEENNLLTGKLLDIGCGKQELLRRLKKRGRFDSLEGCDWIAEKENDIVSGVKYAQIDLNKTSLAEYQDNFYDIIISSEVFEHIENPLSLLKQINRKLKNNCFFAFSVPNATNIYERWCFFWTGNSNRYQIEKPGEFGHITFYTNNIIHSLASRANFELICEGKGYIYISGYFLLPQFLFPRLFSYSSVYLLRKIV